MSTLKNNDSPRRIAMRLQVSLIIATLTFGVWLATPARAHLFLQHRNLDGRLGVLSQHSSPVETETADDFVLTHTDDIHQSGHHHRV